MLRIALPALALLLAVAVVVHRLDQDGTTPTVPPPMGAAGLAALDDAQLERQVMSDLGHRVLAPVGRADAWRSFKPAARHVWALGIMEQWLAAYSIAQLRQALQERPESPGFADAHDACVDMDLPEAAQAFTDAASASGAEAGAIQARLGRAKAEPKAHAKRIAYLRQHLDDLAQP